MAEQRINVRLTQNRFVGQGHQAAAQIADGGHVKGKSQNL